MTQLHHNRFGEWWFRCRKCKESALHHYSRLSAKADQELHECGGKR